MTRCFSALIFSGMQIMSRYPLTAQAMARPIPVLPLVASIKVEPGLIRPCLSASSIIRTAIRSLTEPPGLRNSHLARNCTGYSAPILFRRTIGVCPTTSRMEPYTFG